VSGTARDGSALYRPRPDPRDTADIARIVVTCAHCSGPETEMEMEMKMDFGEVIYSGTSTAGTSRR
jgi:hypothetical protein